jgi:hypothetical protein
LVVSSQCAWRSPPRFFQEVPGSTRSLALLAVPHADEVDLFRAEPFAAHPQIIALIGTLAGGLAPRSTGSACNTARAFAAK